ncbi:MAG: transketolase [Alphaproteobacteria bacterium]
MENVAFFEEKARVVRRQIFEKYVLLQQGHPGSSLSMADLAVALYYGSFVRMDPNDSGRLYDKVIVSKGHATACLYPILSDLGVIPAQEWENWGRDATLLRLFGNTRIPGIDAVSGSLGHGLGIAAGYALSFKRRGLDRRVFVIVSEGELYEGSVWEGLLFASHHRLDNLYIIIDRNNLITLGDTETCLRLEPIKQKIEAFGFLTYDCDGHDFNEILGSLEQMINARTPSCLVAKTVKGKGVRMMENKPHWHYWHPLTPAELELCRKDLR